MEEVTDTEFKGMNSAMSDEERDYKLDMLQPAVLAVKILTARAMEIKIAMREVKFACSEFCEGNCSWRYKHW